MKYSEITHSVVVDLPIYTDSYNDELKPNDPIMTGLRLLSNLSKEPEHISIEQDTIVFWCWDSTRDRITDYDIKLLVKCGWRVSFYGKWIYQT